MTNSNNVEIHITADGKQAEGTLSGISKQIGDVGSQSGESARKVEDFAGQFDNLGGNAAKAGQGVGSITEQIVRLAPQLAALELGRQFLNANRDIESARLALTAITGDAGATTAQLARLRDTANRLGMDVSTATDSFIQLAASAKGTALEGAATEEIFNAVAGAMGKLGKSSTETDRALVALSQMMSKGVVSAEEMRGQLGEALPGAMQLAAKATGLTVEEFGKLMESGGLLASDLLPKLAKEIEKTYQTNEQVESFDAQINRLKNTFTGLLTTIGDAGVFKGLGVALAGANLAATQIITSFEVVGKQLGVIAGAVATLDFSRIGEEFAAIEQVARDKIGKAAAEFVEFTTNTKAAGQAVTEAGAAVAAASGDWNRLIVDYQQVNAAVEEYIKQAKAGVDAAKAQADAMAKTAALAGSEAAILQAKVDGLRLVEQATQKAADMDRIALEVAKAKLAALEAEIEGQKVVDSAKQKAIGELRTEIDAKQQAVDKSTALAAATRQEAAAAELAAQTHGDQSQQLGALRAAYAEAAAESLRLAAAQKDGAASAEQVTAAREKEAAALVRYRDALNDTIASTERNAAAAQRATALGQQAADVAITQATNEQKLAIAKGDTAKAAEAGLRIAELELAKANSFVQAKEAELAAQQAVAAAKVEEIKQSEKADAVKKSEIQTIQDGVKAKELEVQAARAAAQGKADALNQERDAASSAADATAELGKQTSDASGFAQDFAAIWNGLTSELRNMSTATVNKFYEGMGMAFRESADEADNLRSSIAAAKAELWDAKMQTASNPWAALFRDMAVSANTAKIAFLEQKLSAEATADAITRRVGDANVTMAELARYANRGTESFDMLDQSDLSNLQSAIDSAKSKLQSLEAQARSARDAMSGMADSLEMEIARANGNMQEVIRLQNEQKRRELDALNKQSGGTGGAEYARAKALLDQKQRIELEEARRQEEEAKNREREEKNNRREAETTGSRSSSSGSGAGVSIGGGFGQPTAAPQPAARPAQTVNVNLSTPSGKKTSISLPDRVQAEGLINALKDAGLVAGKG